MKFDYSFYSLLNTNINPVLKNKNLLQSAIKLTNKNSPFLQSITDSVSFGAGKQFSINQKLLSSISKINNKEIKPLNATNNVLSFDKGSFYKLQTKTGRTVILTGDNISSVYMPYSELNLGNDFFLPSDYKEIDRVEKFFTYLSSDMSGYCVRSNYTKEETKEMLADVGIKPGWLEVKNGPKSHRFYMLDDGTIYPEYQVEAHRGALNTENYFKEGYTKDSVFIIDGKEYKLDDNGHLHVPKGTACLMEKIKRIK